MTGQQGRQILAFNQILIAVPDQDFERLRQRMRVVELREMQTIHRAEEPIGHVYFPITAVLAQTQTFLDGNTIELSMVGHEGVSGLSALLGHKVARFDTVVRIPGTAYQLPAPVIASELHGSRTIARTLQCYTRALLAQIAQRIACACHHTLEQRMASYLLMLCDRAGPGAMRLTHEVLAQSLGVGRPSVTLNIDSMQESGVVRLGRGLMTVLDRQALETMACECYRNIHEEYTQLLGTTPLDQRLDQRPAADSDTICWDNIAHEDMLIHA